MKFKIYTDGACSGNPGPGGWGAVIFDNDNNQTNISGKEKNTTNNRMEILAAIMALKKINKKHLPKLLAKAKALSVSKKNTKQLVVGSDTIILLNNKIINKARLITDIDVIKYFIRNMLMFLIPTSQVFLNLIVGFLEDYFAQSSN